MGGKATGAFMIRAAWAAAPNRSVGREGAGPGSSRLGRREAIIRRQYGVIPRSRFPVRAGLATRRRARERDVARDFLPFPFPGVAEGVSAYRRL